MKIKEIISLNGELIKTKQTFLLLYTSVFAFFITAVEFPGVYTWDELVFVTLSLFLAISGTTALNMYLDRDIDAIMERTKNRPLPSGKLKPSTVLQNGIFLVIVGMLIAILTLNLLTVFIIFLGFFFDVVIYTILLKRRTKLSILFGGIAGGLPALAGRTVIIGVIDVTGLLFLFFILAWIPVHILTIALIPRNFNGYRKAKIPMWSVVSTEKKTMRIIAIGAFFTSIILYENARHLQVNGIIRIIIGICCFFLMVLVMRNLMKPSNKLTFLIFKVASLFMIIGFLLLYLGVVFL
ncbi:hypothetical protein LCGC14_1016550 [marine sediment metagenome]|uniref:Heme O synthase n=1 Tax=marine sediment metagenome TaxID=412755 RepID=A0A0F9QGW7_9ZZZZ|nr:protoheme IX farnesyltransferase [archaeon]